MLLANVDDVIAALGYDKMTDISNAAAMAVDAAESQLGSILNTEFDQGTFVDTYFVSELPGHGTEAQFRLRRGLLTSLTSMLVSPDPTQFGNPSYATDVSDCAITDLTKGFVKDFRSQFVLQAAPVGNSLIFRGGYRRRYVQITYLAGFAPDPNNPASYLISSVPDWLQQAAKLNALIGLADSPALTEAMIKLDTKTLQLQYNALLQRKLRYAPLAQLPL